jgi:hypothetical protein
VHRDIGEHHQTRQQTQSPNREGSLQGHGSQAALGIAGGIADHVTRRAPGLFPEILIFPPIEPLVVSPLPAGTKLR